MQWQAREAELARLDRLSNRREGGFGVRWGVAVSVRAVVAAHAAEEPAARLLIDAAAVLAVGDEG